MGTSYWMHIKKSNFYLLRSRKMYGSVSISWPNLSIIVTKDLIPWKYNNQTLFDIFYSLTEREHIIPIKVDLNWIYCCVLRSIVNYLKLFKIHLLYHSDILRSTYLIKHNNRFIDAFQSDFGFFISHRTKLNNVNFKIKVNRSF